MKQLLFVKYLLLFIFSISTAAQEIRTDIVLYESGRDYIDATYEGDLYHNYISGKGKIKEEASATIKQLNLKALENYNELIKNYPNSEYFVEALFEKANIEFWYKSRLEAKETFTKVIAISNSSSLKNESFIKLAAISIDEKDYTKALNFLDESKKYIKLYTCGTEYDSDAAILKRMYNQCNEALKQ